MFCALGFETQRGRSLVDLMVGITIAMLVIFFAASIAVGHNSRATAMGSASDATGQALFVYHSMAREIRQAGFGLAGTPPGCMADAWRENRQPGAFRMPMFPVYINPSWIAPGDPGTDVIYVLRGNGASQSSEVRFRTVSSSAASIKVSNRQGLLPGDVLVALSPDGACKVVQATNLPASGICDNAGGDPDVVIISSGSFRDPSSGCAQSRAIWNRPGNGIDFSSGTLFNIGRDPVAVAYAVRNSTLVVCDVAKSDCANPSRTKDPSVWSPIAFGIIALQAEYGRDDSSPPDGVVDRYDKTPPSAGCDVSRIVSVRFGLAAMSQTRETQPVASSPPSWEGGAFDMTSVPDWRYRRFRVQSGVVNLRNASPSC
ncbi:MAG: hypothetical protein DI596_02965 [Azospira oryzae]|nr:MAG: hypothetical protein DI596_02965 [Azospira oryzae]PZP81976.1 MAG: hypothetical protein DI593_02965 [Azospira oryzae]